MKTYNVNNQIKSSNVRLIDADGEQVGIVSIAEALSVSRDQGMDLVQVSNSDPPVAKVINYDKLAYSQAKREKEMKRKQRDTRVRIFNMRSGIANHDINVKVNKINKLLKNKKTVKIAVALRGREIERREIAEEVMNKTISGTDNANIQYQVTSPIHFENGVLAITIAG